MEKLNLTGQRFGRLRVISEVIDPRPGSYWRCLCDCGNQKIIQGIELTRKENPKRKPTQSCGCVSRPHGKAASPEYRVWRAMKNRCYNPSFRGYQNYGGRGIQVSSKWVDSFSTFYADMGARPEGGTLERKDNTRNYGPDNCKWANRKEQANNRRTNVLISYEGKNYSVAQLAELLGKNEKSFRRYFRERNLSLSESIARAKPRGG